MHEANLFIVDLVNFNVPYKLILHHFPMRHRSRDLRYQAFSIFHYFKYAEGDIQMVQAWEFNIYHISLNTSIPANNKTVAHSRNLIQ